MPSMKPLSVCAAALVVLAAACAQDSPSPAGRLPALDVAQMAEDTSDAPASPLAVPGSAVAGDRAAPPASAGAPRPAASSGPAVSARPTIAAPAELTPTGTVLALGTPGIAMQEQSKTPGPIKVTPQSITRGVVEDVAAFDLDAHLKSATPFYVTVIYENVGDADITAPMLSIRLNALNTDGDTATRLDIIGNFPRCTGPVAPDFSPGATFTDCQVFLLPDGQSIQTITWEGLLLEEPLTWTVVVEPR